MRKGTYMLVAVAVIIGIALVGALITPAAWPSLPKNPPDPIPTHPWLPEPPIKVPIPEPTPLWSSPQ